MVAGNPGLPPSPHSPGTQFMIEQDQTMDSSVSQSAGSMTSRSAILSPRKRVVASVRRWVEQGELSRGDILPTEQELCSTLQVSRGTVRATGGLMANTVVLVTHLLDVTRPEADEGVLGAIDTGSSTMDHAGTGVGTGGRRSGKWTRKVQHHPGHHLRTGKPPICCPAPAGTTRPNPSREISSSRN